ncbi:antitoxin [Streptomyces sp. NPDC006208]|uniref:antitoxin n=1 Tax=Streptomyces sp. NPDC006208 TaxID=3156734 RepID=UPI00339E3D26
MGFMDTLKAKLAPAKDKVSHFALEHEDKIGQRLDKAAHKVSHFALEHEDKIGQRLDKAAHKVDTTTKGKYSSKIETGTGKAKETLGRIAHKGDGMTPPPAS